ncbi:MAG: FlgD immunoglobulin-like domain containing protein, partial [Limisphaerales bacterium]
SVVRSIDTGKTWSNRFAAIPAYEIGFQDSALWLGVFDSLLFSGNNGQTFKSVLMRDTVTKLSLARRSVLALLTDANSVWAGTTNGAGFTTSDSGQNWGVFRTEGEEAHQVKRYFFSLTNPTVPGNFGVVLGVQKGGTNKAVWVGSHTTDVAGERSGVARSLDDGGTWSVYFLDTLAWNFAFWGDAVWVASSSGLFRSPDMGQNWQPVPIAGVDAYSGAATSFSDAVEILSVRQVDDTTVWAGSTDGAAVSFDLGLNWRIFRRFLSTGTGPGTAGAELYAAPVPFSPTRGQTCRFHYRLKQTSTNTTIEIFDFSMRLVNRKIINELRQAGVQYDTDFWDGKNGKGEEVANGTYFFRISAGGEKQWGKLVVLK